jgi:hypothetical protein
MENNNVTKCPTTHGNKARHTNTPTEKEAQPQGNAGTPTRAGKKKKVLPPGGGVCTVGYPAPPVYFIKFENDLPTIIRNRHKPHG